MESGLICLNILIEVAIKHNNKFYKFVIKICYSNVNCKARCYYKYASFCSKQLQNTNRDELIIAKNIVK